MFHLLRGLWCVFFTEILYVHFGCLVVRYRGAITFGNFRCSAHRDFDLRLNLQLGGWRGSRQRPTTQSSVQSMMSLFTEISLLFQDVIIQKFSYERRDYKLVDEKSLTKAMSRKITKKQRFWSIKG